MTLIYIFEGYMSLIMLSMSLKSPFLMTLTIIVNDINNFNVIKVTIFNDINNCWIDIHNNKIYLAHNLGNSQDISVNILNVINNDQHTYYPKTQIRTSGSP